MKSSLFLTVLLFMTLACCKAQPFADLVSVNFQNFSSTYKNDENKKNRTEDYFFNLFLPKEFKNGNAFLTRLNTSSIPIIIISQLPIGFMLVTANKKWKTIVIAVPKVASDFKDKISTTDFQMGGIFLQNYSCNDRLKLKAGLYYNREAFGNFFVPLAGLDWKVTDRINLYGILPTSYKIEFILIRDKLYSGLNFKSVTRSFRLSMVQNHDYVRYDEMQLKIFLDYFLYKKILLFGEIGYAIGKTPLQYLSGTKKNTEKNQVYTPLKNGLVLNIGIAYRMRFDLTH